MSLLPYQFDEFDKRLRAQTEATLALAYEARTANLIAMWANPSITTQAANGNAVTWSMGEDNAGKFLMEILERLGVKP